MAWIQGLHDYYRLSERALDCTPDFGGLAFYGQNELKITHVGFCLNPSLMLESGGGNSKTKTFQDATKQNAYIKMRPIYYRVDFLKCLIPKAFQYAFKPEYLS